MKVKQILTLIGTGLVGSLAGFLITSGSHKNTLQSVATGMISAGATAYIQRFIYDNKLAKKERELAELQRNLEEVFRNKERDLKNKVTNIQRQANKFEKVSEYLAQALVGKLNFLEENRRLVSQLEQMQQYLSDSQDTLDLKNRELQALRSDTDLLHQKINQLEQEAIQADLDFDQVLETQVQIRVANWVDNWANPYDEIISDTFKLKDKLLNCASKLKTRSQDRKDFVLGYADQLNKVVSNAEENFNRERVANLERIELLNEKVARLQQLVNKDLVEPIFKEVGYSEHGRIANDIAKELFRIGGIPLEVLGFQQTEETTRVGYGYSKSVEVKELIAAIQSLSSQIAKELKIHSINSVTQSEVAPVIHLTFQKEPPKPESVEAIYKAGLIPASQALDIIAKATDHKHKGKPTLRVMAATGEGKGIVVKNLLAHFSDMEDWEIWLSDPVSSSDEDHWDTPKIAESPATAEKAYFLFAQLHQQRYDQKQPGFTDRKVLAVFDEFDKQHEDEDKELAKKIMTAIRHSKQRQILIGQCAEVGANKWTWDDMQNCGLLVLGNSIGSLIKHLRTDFGMSTKKVNQIKREYERFSTWADNQNSQNPDIPNENQTRIGFLLVSGKYQFLELPIAHKGILKNGKAIFRTDLAQRPLQVAPKTILSKAEVVSTDAQPKPLPKCPHCQSTSLSKNGKGRYKCKDCGKSSSTSKLIY